MKVSSKQGPTRTMRPMSPSHTSLQYMMFLFAMIVHTVSTAFIDMDTPLDKRTTKSLIDGTTYHLVMSDEFNTPNRSFADGHDPVWTALDKSDDDASSAGGGSLQFYNSSTVTTTKEGMLKIATELGTTEWNRYDHVKKEWKHETTYFKSGMVQSWDKFCFTGGIVEVDVIFPGDPFIGGLWPAIWMLGNLGRATYEASTNNIWPWSFDTCDRDKQEAQAISACNEQNHYGLNPFQGRGATEIDIVEVMAGDSNGPLPQTDPPVSIPYADMTLQVAPGVPKNRPQPGTAPERENTLGKNGHTEFTAQTWYEGLAMQGNTSINPFFYGTYLAETKPYEPVTRSKEEAFQADAIGVLHQLTPAHFNVTHTFRVEWQPGPGGRIDWYSKGHKINATFSMEGDGLGQDWVHAYALKDKSLKDLMGSQVPNEPTYLIMNTAISSTWGFPYDVPDWCEKCYDCEDPKCACAFSPGFCKMLRGGNVAMYIDSVRVYQSRDPDAHVGNNHTVGCDPPAYPTKEFIQGHTYRYMRNPPFSWDDRGPLRKVQSGGGECQTDTDCGSHVQHENLTKIYDDSQSTERRDGETVTNSSLGRGQCVQRDQMHAMFSSSTAAAVCKCNDGFTGPYCLAQAHVDESESAHELRTKDSPFNSVAVLRVTPFMVIIVGLLVPFLLSILIAQVLIKKRSMASIISPLPTPGLYRPLLDGNGTNELIITGRSV